MAENGEEKKGGSTLNTVERLLPIALIAGVIFMFSGLGSFAGDVLEDVVDFTKDAFKTISKLGGDFAGTLDNIVSDPIGYSAEAFVDSVQKVENAVGHVLNPGSTSHLPIRLSPYEVAQSFPATKEFHRTHQYFIIMNAFGAKKSAESQLALNTVPYTAFGRSHAEWPNAEQNGPANAFVLQCMALHMGVAMEMDRLSWLDASDLFQWNDIQDRYHRQWSNPNNQLLVFPGPTRIPRVHFPHRFPVRPAVYIPNVAPADMAGSQYMMPMDQIKSYARSQQWYNESYEPTFDYHECHFWWSILCQSIFLWMTRTDLVESNSMFLSLDRKWAQPTYDRDVSMYYPIWRSTWEEVFQKKGMQLTGTGCSHSVLQQLASLWLLAGEDAKLKQMASFTFAEMFSAQNPTPIGLHLKGLENLRVMWGEYLQRYMFRLWSRHSSHFILPSIAERDLSKFLTQTDVDYINDLFLFNNSSYPSPKTSDAIKFFYVQRDSNLMKSGFVVRGHLLYLMKAINERGYPPDHDETKAMSDRYKRGVIAVGAEYGTPDFRARAQWLQEFPNIQPARAVGTVPPPKQHNLYAQESKYLSTRKQIHQDYTSQNVSAPGGFHYEPVVLNPLWHWTEEKTGDEFPARTIERILVPVLWWRQQGRAYWDNFHIPHVMQDGTEYEAGTAVFKPFNDTDREIVKLGPGHSSGDIAWVAHEDSLDFTTYDGTVYFAGTIHFILASEWKEDFET